MKKIDIFIPQTLRSRLFIAFLFLIFVPFSILNFYIFGEFEELIQQKVTQQTHSQLENMNKTLEELMGVAVKSIILLEQDTTVISVLKEPNQDDPLGRKYKIEDKFRSINNSLFLSSPQVYFTLNDFYGNVYTSYQPNKPLNFNKLEDERFYQQLLSGNSSYLWATEGINYVHKDISKSEHMLTLYALLKDEHYKPYGVARVSLDYIEWFNKVIEELPIQQDYSIIAGDDVIIQSNPYNGLDSKVIATITSQQRKNGYFMDQVSSSILNYTYIEPLDWYLVNRVPLSVLFKELTPLKNQYYIPFILLTLAFIFFTFTISSAITRPLRELQVKMKEVVHTNRQVQLPENIYKGEVQVLAKAFNQMVRDMDNLIEELKLNEVQKQAIHFQMLLSQTNPHFLLNTLNTIKWIALRKQNQDIAEICVSLGKLLETSLNPEVELIHLQDEIELVKSYVYIQTFRYRNRFEVIYELAEELEFALVPKLSLQPLVENAINHGIAPMTEPGKIKIRIYIVEQYLTMEVEDNGVGIEIARKVKPHRKREGIGLNNIQKRLDLLFHQDADFQIASLDQGTKVRISFPLLLSTPYEDGGYTHVEGIAR